MFGWLTRSETYPLIGAVCIASTLAVYASVRHLTSNPDVMLAKKKRSLGIASEQDLAALEQARAHQQSGLFRAVAKISPSKPDPLMYPNEQTPK